MGYQMEKDSSSILRGSGRFVLLPKDLVTEPAKPCTLVVRLACNGRAVPLWKVFLKPRLSRGFLCVGKLSPEQTAPYPTLRPPLSTGLFSELQIDRFVMAITSLEVYSGVLLLTLDTA